MSVSPDTAQGLIKELYLMGRAIRIALQHPEERQLLPGGTGILGTLEVRGPCRQVDLVEELVIGPSALSRHVTELVSAGYIRRHSDPGDRRASLIVVTETGRELLGRIRLSRSRRLQSALDAWTEAEAEQARVLIQKLRNSLAAHAHRTNGR
ncbi:MAG: putative transcriptional regulator [Nocardia sp.]|uniref:MarR family winged helix-turn-helix transcriptional regulator n=1 Tax=Nocardia sp. TaxID=1821 RepID=UPI0026128CC0|nr:MarR family winged helix-turn-helix transcriptional regulator [Nocardia sp.]MCU1644395.1 putative transcriptional regulator [Nocardia sp.]